MKNYLFVASFFTYSLFSAQKVVNAKIITMDNDTINTKVKVVTNMFDSSLIYGSTFNNKIKVFDKDDKKSTLEVSQIKELTFTDYNGKKRFFVNNSQDKKSLGELIYKGAVIDWYRMFSATNGGENASDILYNKETNKSLGTVYFTGLPKKKLKEFFADVTEMESYIEEAKTSPLRNADNSIDNVMESIIKKYEFLKAKKIIK